jgi:aspartyl-tRNA(Asn)/glutamyl-tRNA(Gln) amidotransferase subunit C
MQISQNTVTYIAHLARIALEDSQLEKLTHDLESIVGYIDKLNNASLVGVEPTSHVLALRNVYRPDIVKPSLTQSDALKISTTGQKGFFSVPQIIE